jgi:hypothetical protein
MFVEHAGNRVDVKTLLRVRLIHQAHDGGFGLDDLIVCRYGVTLLHVAVAVRGARQHVDRSLLRTVALAAARPLGNLRPLVFGDYSLELHQQVVFRSRSGRRFQKYQLHAAAGQLLGQQDLVGILAAQAVRRVDESRLDVSCRRQIAQGFQAGP